MIFAVATDERSLQVFANELEAVAACEALDVEAGTWLFWSNDGSPLEPVFTVPNRRGLFIAKNGVYHLQAASSSHHAHLSEAIEEVVTFEGPEPASSASAIKAYLADVQSLG